jgi:hypothetical protein
VAEDGVENGRKTVLLLDNSRTLEEELGRRNGARELKPLGQGRELVSEKTTALSWMVAASWSKKLMSLRLQCLLMMMLKGVFVVAADRRCFHRHRRCQPSLFVADPFVVVDSDDIVVVNGGGRTRY